jgi:hypothetical protein
MRIYRGFSIWFDPKPIPHRDVDFDFAHLDYDGPGDKRCGNGASVSDCQDRIDEIIEDEE